MNNPLPAWEHFAHQADIGVRGYGADLATAFAQAAVAMTAVITDPGKVRPLEKVSVRCQAPDPELLLVDWLNALVYEMATRRMLFSEFQVAIEDDVLTAQISGEKTEPGRHQPAVEIKGATYTQLWVAQLTDGRWLAQCVVDV